MTLNLITCLFRSGNLAKIKASIPDHPDINWIIVLSKHRSDLIKECNDLNLPFLTIDEPDPDIASVATSNASVKVNKAISCLKPGYFQGLDDDTIFNPNAYWAFKKLQDYKMIIGSQKLQDGTLRIAQPPRACYTDGAQAIIHTEIVEQVFFGSFTTNPVADYNFLQECWLMTNPTERTILNEVISNYNFLR